MSWFTSIRDTVESSAVVAGDYFVPGSSILTKNVASTGSQKQLNTTVGKVAQIGASGVGLGIGSSYTGVAPSTVGKAMQVGIDKATGAITKGGAALLTGVAAVGGAAKNIAPLVSNNQPASPGVTGGGTVYIPVGNDPNAVVPTAQTANVPAKSDWTLPAVVVTAGLLAVKMLG